MARAIYPTRILGGGGAVRGTYRTGRPEAPLALPQPGLRLIGISSLGIGSGLFSASVPPEMLVLAFTPAVVSLVVLAVRATFAGPAWANENEEGPDRQNQPDLR